MFTLTAGSCLGQGQKANFSATTLQHLCVCTMMYIFIVRTSNSFGPPTSAAICYGLVFIPGVTCIKLL